MAEITVVVEVPEGSECKSEQGFYCRFHTDFGMCRLFNDRRPRQGLKKCRQCLVASKVEQSGRDGAERLERSEGCDMCMTEYDREDWRDGGGHDFRVDGGALYYFDSHAGWEGMAIRYCPACGRKLV